MTPKLEKLEELVFTSFLSFSSFGVIENSSKSWCSGERGGDPKMDPPPVPPVRLKLNAFLFSGLVEGRLHARTL